MRYTTKSQLSIVIPNQPGEIARVTKILADNKINIEGVMFVDTTAQGVVRFVVVDTQGAKKILEDAGFFVAVTEIVEVEFTHKVGALCELSAALGEAGVNIDYAYGTQERELTTMTVAFKFSDLNKAITILKKL